MCNSPHQGQTGCIKEDTKHERRIKLPDRFAPFKVSLPRYGFNILLLLPNQPLHSNLAGFTPLFEVWTLQAHQVFPFTFNL